MVTHSPVCCQIALLLFTCLVCAADISCRNEQGNPVDWFIIYKLPKYKIDEVGSGVEYMYLDESVARWQMSKYMINSSQGAIANTLNQLYLGKAYMSNSLVYVLYNDGPPDLKYIQAYGHTKGVLLFDHTQGFWLSHSIPHFPSFPERGYLYPSSGKLNGQTMLCMTYQYAQFLKIAQQLEYLYPRIYNCSVPTAFSADLPQLAKLCKGSKPALASDKSVQTLFSHCGEKFVSFAKSKHFVEGSLLKSLRRKIWKPAINIGLYGNLSAITLNYFFLSSFVLKQATRAHLEVRFNAGVLMWGAVSQPSAFGCFNTEAGCDAVKHCIVQSRTDQRRAGNEKWQKKTAYRAGVTCLH